MVSPRPPASQQGPGRDPCQRLGQVLRPRRPPSRRRPRLRLRQRHREVVSRRQAPPRRRPSGDLSRRPSGLVQRGRKGPRRAQHLTALARLGVGVSAGKGLGKSFTRLRGASLAHSSLIRPRPLRNASMKVVITGATGNVGTSTVKALSESPEIEEIIGLARRAPFLEQPKTSWVEANVLTSDLTEIFRAADAVIHLAWAIQPSRDAVTLERINVEGSRRVFEAVAAARVPKLVHASSVGAYSRGPKDRQVDESWPTQGTSTSFYSRHKVAVERELDRFEGENPETRVVRLRPALIFKDEAATEIRRLFIGPFLPSFLLHRRLLVALPRIERLRF